MMIISLAFHWSKRKTSHVYVVLALSPSLKRKNKLKERKQTTPTSQLKLPCYNSNHSLSTISFIKSGSRIFPQCHLFQLPFQIQQTQTAFQHV